MNQSNPHFSQKLPELLAPAGSPEALHAAISAGADAVYFGGAAFSNRMRARNFDTDELTEALATTNRYGVNSYITINTRVRDDEMGDVLTLAEFLLKGGCTGFIVADMGIAAQLHARFPEAMLHASTQMTLANAADARMMAEHGFTRMVVPREISLEELTALVKESPLEIEMFLHGAYCVSVSGQCLMSWAMGGRSGNRGECAQPCRMVYRVDRGISDSTHTLNGPHIVKTNGGDKKRLPTQDSRNPAEYPLSLKDMCLANHIPAIVESGVSSLKIEGRQKPAPYVYGVTRIYRTLLDENRVPTREEMAELDNLFSRGGFTDGYFRSATDKKAYAGMGGIRPTTEEQKKDGTEAVSTPARYDLSHRTVPCTGKLTLHPDRPATLTMQTGEVSVTVTGDIPQAATGSPVTAETLLKNLLKLGGTPFHWDKNQPETEVADGLWMPVSAVNALRRLAADALEKAYIPKPDIAEGKPYVRLYGKKNGSMAKTACPGSHSPAIGVLSGREQWYEGLADGFQMVFLPVSDWLVMHDILPENVGADLSPLVFAEGTIQKQIEALSEHGCPAVRFHSPGQLYHLRQTNMTAYGSFRLNVWNGDALDWWYRHGAAYVTLSPEVTLAGYRTLAAEGIPGGAVVYGHIPLMLTERCLLRTIPRQSSTASGKKAKGKPDETDILCGGLGGRIPSFGEKEPHCGGMNGCSCYGGLTDRLGHVFPIRAVDGQSVVCNGVPLWMADKMETLPSLTHREFLFTIESASEIQKVLMETAAGAGRGGKRLK